MKKPEGACGCSGPGDPVGNTPLFQLKHLIAALEKQEAERKEREEREKKVSPQIGESESTDTHDSTRLVHLLPF